MRTGELPGFRLDTTGFEAGLRRAAESIRQFAKACDELPRPPTLQDLRDIKASIDDMAREEPARG